MSFDTIFFYFFLNKFFVFLSISLEITRPNLLRVPPELSREASTGPAKRTFFSSSRFSRFPGELVYLRRSSLSCDRVQVVNEHHVRFQAFG